MRKLNPLFYALVASSSIAGVATADDGVVLSVRPDGVVADVSPMEDVRRGTKLGFVREDGEREETGQGRVLHVRDGKAQVKLATKSDVKKGDLVVLCPDLNEDPYDELRATVAEIQEQAGQGSTARKRSSRLHEATSKLQAALEARDEAVEEGLCDMASHDAKIEALAQDLAKVSAGRKTATARAPGQGSRPTPAQKSEDQEAADEEPAKPKAGAKTEEQSTQMESEADEESEPKADAKQPGSTRAQGDATDKGGLGSALGVLGRLMEALPGATKRGGSEAAEGTSAGAQEKDGLQGALDVFSKLAGALPGKSKRRGSRSETEGERSPAPREEAAPDAQGQADEESDSHEATPPDEAQPPRSAGSNSQGAAPSQTDAARDESAPPRSGSESGKGGKLPSTPTRLPSSLDRILGDRIARTTPEATRPGLRPQDRSDVRTPERNQGGRSQSREPKLVTVAGRVVSSKGRPLAGVRVAVGDLATTTNKDGRFELANVKPGQYDVSVSATGFGPVKRTLSVRPSGRPLNFTLRPVQAAKEGQPTTSIKRPRKFGEVDE